MTSSPATLSRRLNRPRRRLRISLTPLIDVVFILLVFFMLASSFLDFRSINLSAAPTGQGAPGLEGALLIELTVQGPRLAGAAIEPAALVEYLTKRVVERPEQRVLVRPRAGVATQRLVDLLDLIAAAGITDISLLAARS